MNGLGLRLGYHLTLHATPACQYPSLQDALASEEAARSARHSAVVAFRKTGVFTEYGAEELEFLYDAIDTQGAILTQVPLFSGFRIEKRVERTLEPAPLQRILFWNIFTEYKI